MNDVVRFPANVPFAKWPQAYAFFQACYQGNWSVAAQLWDDSTKTNPADPTATYITDSVGAVQLGYTTFEQQGYPTQIVMDGANQATLTPGETPKQHVFAPGILYLWRATASGNGSGSFDDVLQFGAAVFDTPPAGKVPKSAIPFIGTQTYYPVPVTTDQQIGFINLGNVATKGRVDIRV